MNIFLLYSVFSWNHLTVFAILAVSKYKHCNFATHFYYFCQTGRFPPSAQQVLLSLHYISSAFPHGDGDYFHVLREKDLP